MTKVIVRLEKSKDFRSITFINCETGDKVVFKSHNKLKRKFTGFGKSSV